MSMQVQRNPYTPYLAVSVSWPGVRGGVTLQPLGDVFVCPEAVISVFTCNVTNQPVLQWMVGPLEDTTIETRFFQPPFRATVASSSSGAVPFMAILDHVSGTDLSSTLTVQLNRTSHRVIIVKCSDVQSNEAVSHIMPAGMNGGQITMACHSKDHVFSIAAYVFDATPGIIITFCLYCIHIQDYQECLVI